MKIMLESRFGVGDIVTWNAPYWPETVTITGVRYYDNSFKYKTKQYTFEIDEIELEEMK